jgi:hypothetical protein
MVVVVIAIFVVMVTAFLMAAPPLWKKVLQSCIELVVMLSKSKYHSHTKVGTNYNFADEFEARVDLDPEVLQFICAEDGRQVKLGELDAHANQVSHWAIELGVQPK